MIPTALTIAGSDPSGGAGIQADLKTFSALRVYGMTVITALTAQNSLGVSEVFDVPEASIEAQFKAVVEDVMPLAVKTGMLATSHIVTLIAKRIRDYQIRNVVVDPVITSTSGSTLLADGGVDALRRHLLPLARIVTPNLDEAKALTGRQVVTVDDMEEAALAIHGFGAASVYVKGGHLEGDAVDVFFDGKEFTRLHGKKIQSGDTHGTGCVLAAAMTAYLARGEPPHTAVQLAKEVVTVAIQNALRLGRGRGPCDPIGIKETR